MHDDNDAAASEAASPWPDSLERGRVGEGAFAAAYARVTDRQRAWIKTALAALYAAWGGPRPLDETRQAALGHDLRLTRLDTPLDYALVACGPGFASPARLAAAILPALCARVPEVAAVRVGGGAWPRPLLTTLELCGVESVFRLGSRAFAGLARELAALGRGALVVLDGLAVPAVPTGGPTVLDARLDGPVGVFPGPDAAFDWDALAFAHPDLTFHVHGATPPPTGPFVPGQGALAETAGLGYAAVYAGEADARAALTAAPLVLGPGRESLWLWPRLAPAVFRQRRYHARAAAGSDTR